MASRLPILPAIIRGEEKVFPVYIDIDGEPLDITGYTIEAEIWWDGEPQISLADGSGIEILELAPEADSEGEFDPQYQVRLSEAQSLTLPVGQEAYFKQIRVPPNGVTTIRGPFYLSVKE